MACIMMKRPTAAATVFDFVDTSVELIQVSKSNTSDLTLRSASYVKSKLDLLRTTMDYDV